MFFLESPGIDFHENSFPGKYYLKVHNVLSIHSGQYLAQLPYKNGQCPLTMIYFLVFCTPPYINVPNFILLRLQNFVKRVQSCCFTCKLFLL